MFQRKRKTDEQSKYRGRQSRQVNAASVLADEFPHLRLLSMELGQYDLDRRTRVSQMKQTVNLQHTSSIVRVHCGNIDCVGGDFDLTHDLAEAAAVGRGSVTGELRCRGWRDEASIKKVRCGRVLRYKLILEYV